MCVCVCGGGGLVAAAGVLGVALPFGLSSVKNNRMNDESENAEDQNASLSSLTS